MKLLTTAMLLAASAIASAQTTPAQSEYQSGFRWAIGLDNAGPAATWAGGDLRTPTVEEGSKRRAGPAKVEDVRLTLTPYFEIVTRDWVGAALDGENPARDIHILELTANRATLFQGSKITEFMLPDLDRSINQNQSDD